MSESASRQGRESPQGALDRLLASERELAERLVRADAEASSLLEEARRTAEAAERGAEAELARELAEFDARHETALLESLHAMALECGRVLSHHERVGEERIGELAKWALLRVVGVEEGEAEGEAPGGAPP